MISWWYLKKMSNIIGKKDVSSDTNRAMSDKV
jgi:hypothetical protein